MLALVGTPARLQREAAARYPTDRGLACADAMGAMVVAIPLAAARLARALGDLDLAAELDAIAYGATPCKGCGTLLRPLPAHLAAVAGETRCPKCATPTAAKTEGAT